MGRRLCLKRVLGYGWTLAWAAESMGASRTTSYIRLRRFDGEGEAGLINRSSRGRAGPRTLLSES